VVFPLGTYLQNTFVHYDANRKRSETVRFILEANVQSILTEPGSAEEQSINLSSTYIADPVDDGSIPLHNLGSNTYFLTDRGVKSFEYLLLLARTKLLQRARAVIISITVQFDKAINISCRDNVVLTDHRLPGGTATGKVTGYRLRVDGDIGEQLAEITFACAVGYGDTVTPRAGTTGYAAPGYMTSGYQKATGGQQAADSGDIVYTDFSNFEVVDDDGLDLSNMTSKTVLMSLTVTDGVNDQVNAINAAVNKQTNSDPISALRGSPTRVILELVPVEGGAFNSDFTVVCSNLVIPKMIDLEAA
jgi:hypothetical protein